MLVGALIFVLGIDLIKEAVWDTRHRTSRCVLHIPRYTPTYIAQNRVYHDYRHHDLHVALGLCYRCSLRNRPGLLLLRDSEFSKTERARNLYRSVEYVRGAPSERTSRVSPRGWEADNDHATAR